MGKDLPRGQARLKAEVLDRDLCVRCGACVGICPYFQYFDGRVVQHDTCMLEEGACGRVCPVLPPPPSRVREAASLERPWFGACREILMARAVDPGIRERAQYGGVVSALILHAMGRGDILGAVMTDRGNGRSPGGRLVRDPAGILACAGSRYSGSGTLSALHAAVRGGEERLALVGLPCQMEALSRMEGLEVGGREVLPQVVLRIALFCTWALDFRALRRYLQEQGVVGRPGKCDIPPPPAERFDILTEEGPRSFPLSEVRGRVQKGCAMCRDMTGVASDLSVGALEGVPGWNTVLVRTEVGAARVQAAREAGVIETGAPPEEGIAHLEAAAKGKWERGERVQNKERQGA